MHPIVETYQITPESSQPTEEELEAHRLCCLAHKKNPTEEHKRAAASLTEEHHALAEACKHKRKLANYSAKGWCWYARIIDGKTNDVLYESPLAYKERHYADRHGQRVIRRFRRTGKWEPDGKNTLSIPIKGE